MEKLCNGRVYPLMRGGQGFRWVSEDDGIVDRRLQNVMGPEGI